MSLVGVLLAAGRGRRMGRPVPKQLLPWPPDGDRTLVEASFDAVAPACDRMIVVLGHAADRVAAALEPRRFEPVAADGDAPMLDSIVAGLTAARGVAGAADTGVLLHPADHPGLRRRTLDLLLATHARSPGMAVMPEHAGRGGHPVIVPIALIETILRDAGDGGLRRYWEEHESSRIRVPVDDPWVHRDVDEPADYLGER